ncbi:MAG: phage portal protein, partial [Eubacterium sp.]
MSSLKAFLNPVRAENREVVVSERFMEDGKAVPFVIRPILQSENDTLIRKHTKKDKKGNEVFDRVAYSQELVAMAVIEPDLENADLQKANGVLGATKTLTTMLYLGEFATLSE